ncbi:hypothetical protein SAMN05428987_5262 [Paenibacillus sp. CF095]|nr:hypothetical protein SAMN05428987_5262 [Paenibacillus sp. CF095]
MNPERILQWIEQFDSEDIILIMISSDTVKDFRYILHLRRRT